MNSVFHRLGPYEVVREIGRGGMAQVFLATDTRTGRHVALKAVRVATGGEEREILEAEQAGAELQRQFSRISSHVPAVYEHLPNESGYSLVAMEYLDGENLSDVMARGAVGAEQAVRVVIELCTFLEAAHAFEPVIDGKTQRSLIHGDLKPQNIRITSGGVVKVLDFGIAKALSLSRKVTRNEFGTKPYLSPEWLDGEVNEFADLWAVGVMLYEMIAGTRPFDAPDTQRLERIIRSRRPPPALNGRCPAGLEAIVARLLAPSPDVRYESAHAIREDLERFRSGHRTAAEEQGWPGRVFDEEPTRRTRPAADAGDEPTRRTRPDVTTSPAIPVAAGSRPAGPVAAREGGAPAVARPRRSRAFKIALGVATFIVLAILANEFSVMVDARKVAVDVSTRELDQLGDAWAAHARLSAQSGLGFGTRSLDRSLTERTLTLADKVIANYRMALPTVREAQWRSARDALRRALPLAPGDRRLRAALRYCEGHLHRIDGDADKQRNQDGPSQREMAEAVAAFREAAEIRPDWPDPFLGLARVFIYGFDDVDRGADALNQAQRRGYVLTDRETGLLADGYRSRGTGFVRNARKLAGMSQEAEYLAKAIEAYQRALTLYAQASSLPNVTENLRVTQRAIDQAQKRYNELAPGPVEPAPADSFTPSPGARGPGGSVEEVRPWA